MSGNRKHGIRDLQYVLSHNTKLSRELNQCGITFDIDKRIMSVDGKEYSIDLDYYIVKWNQTDLEEKLDSIANRIYYDYCVDGFILNDNVTDYGTEIHKRPEFINTLISISPNARRLDDFWKNNSTPYKVIFFANINQIHKFTFGDLPKDYEPYSESEITYIKNGCCGMRLIELSAIALMNNTFISGIMTIYLLNR